MIYLFYTSYISVELAHHDIVCAKVGKGGIIEAIPEDLVCTRYEPTSNRT